MTNESSAVAALRELVALKDMSNRMGRTKASSPEFRAMAVEYTRRKPLAWAEAKRVVAALSAAPVSPQGLNAAMTAALMMLFDAANEIHGTLDEQTYDEKRRADWDLPDDHAFEVTITAAHERALAKAICVVEAASRAHLAAAPAALAVQPLPLLDQSADSLGAPALPSGSTLQPPAAASAAIPGAEREAFKPDWVNYEQGRKDGRAEALEDTPSAYEWLRLRKPATYAAWCAGNLTPAQVDWIAGWEAACMSIRARGIDSPEGVETGTGSTAKPQEPGPEGAPETQDQPIKSGETP